MTEEYREEIEDHFEPYQEDLSEAIAKTRQEWKNLSSEKAIRHYKEMYNIEMDFARRNDYLASAGNKMSQKEFERWEDAFTDELRLAGEEIQSGKLGTKSEAEAMQHMIAYCEEESFEKSLEVQAGQHYIERDNDLRLAIRKSEGIGSEDDLEYLNGFHPLIIKYFDLKYKSEETEKDDTGTYENKCLKAHNEAISYLNNLNRLAHKYGTRAFTPRNYWTSGLCDKKNQTPAISAVIHYDLSITDNYFAVAFREEANLRQKKSNKLSRYGFGY